MTKRKWNVGDRCSFAASPAPENRTVYSGTIVEVTGDKAYVIEDGYQARCAVALARLHPENAYVVLPSGPRGIRWTA